MVTPSRASMASQNAVPYCDVFSPLIGPMRRWSKPLFGHRETDQAATKLRHEVDRFRSDLFGRKGQIAFVFAVFIVDDDNHAPGANFFDRGRNIGEG